MGSGVHSSQEKGDLGKRQAAAQEHKLCLGVLEQREQASDDPSNKSLTCSCSYDEQPGKFINDLNYLYYPKW